MEFHTYPSVVIEYFAIQLPVALILADLTKKSKMTRIPG